MVNSVFLSSWRLTRLEDAGPPTTRVLAVTSDLGTGHGPIGTHPCLGGGRIFPVSPSYVPTEPLAGVGRVEDLSPGPRVIVRGAHGTDSRAAVKEMTGVHRRKLKLTTGTGQGGRSTPFGWSGDD